MCIDHIGMFIFPDMYFLRIIGRVSMPLFAYSIARGFHYSSQKNKTNLYIRNLFVFAVISQIPYWLLFRTLNIFRLNIGFTWLLSVILLRLLLVNNGIVSKRLKLACLCSIGVIVALSLILPIEYSLYGVLYPCFFYYVVFRKNKPQHLFLGMTVLWGLYFILCLDIAQVFSILALPVLMIADKYDNKIKLPKIFYYSFYPIHLLILWLIVII